MYTREHYRHNITLENTEPIHLEKKAEINMVQMRAKMAKQENAMPMPPELQIKVWEILKVTDKRQLILNADRILDTLNPAKL